VPSLQRRLDLVRHLPRSLRGPALLATLPHADPRERDALVAEVLSLGEAHTGHAGTGAATQARQLLRHWGLLSREARDAVLASLGPRTSDLLRDLLRSDDPTDRAGAVHLAIASLLAGSADLLREPTAFDAGAARVAPEIDEALAEAAERYDEHRNDAVMSAIARIAHRPGARVRAWLNETDQPGHMALRAAARGLPLELARARTVAWLGVPALRGVARDALHRAATPEEWRALLRRSHLLRAPSRRGSLRGSGECGSRLLELGSTPDALAPSEARAVIRWGLALPLKARDATELFAQAFAAPSPLVRFDAVKALASVPADPASDSALVDFAFDESEPVARLATGALAEADSPSRRESTGAPLRRLARSPHASVRRIAAEAIADRDPLNERDLTDPLACPVAARRAMHRNPLEFLITMRKAYSGAPSAARVRLLEMAGRIGVLDRVEAELLDAVGSADERLASKAALLLGRLRESAAAMRALAGAVEAPAARTRANAIEAMLRAVPGHERLAEWSRDETPRARANAVRHRLLVRREPQGERLLAEMLGDDRPGHRLSALWVAERARVPSVVNRVADLTRHDADPRVHARAQRCARALLASMRHGWAAAPIGGE